MAVYSEQRRFRQPRAFMFEIVADVESYPAFLPFWLDARVMERRGPVVHADQTLGMGPVREHFRTEALLWPPERLLVQSRSSQFRTFRIEWMFSEAPGDHCDLRLELECQLAGAWQNPLVDVLIRSMAGGILPAFEARATALEHRRDRMDPSGATATRRRTGGT